MAFTSSSSSSSPSAEINVTPLIDVLLVLLIIFMVIVPVLPRGVESSVPQDRTPGQPSTAPLVMRVFPAKSGGAPRYALGERELALAELRPALAQVFAVRQDHTLFVQADRSLSYGEVAAGLGEARAAGAGALAFLPNQIR